MGGQPYHPRNYISYSIIIFILLQVLALSNSNHLVSNSHRFDPIPGTTVVSHCQWEVRLDTVFNRIPSTITEIVCRNPNTSCSGNSNFLCRQIRAKMVVAYTDRETDSVSLVHKQNVTVSVGCACVQNQFGFLDGFLSPPEERKRKRGG